MNADIQFDINDRVQLALDYFHSGLNCAQSVFMAYADLLGFDKQTASNLSVSFGGGMGRMREVCGAVSAMSMLAGFIHPVTDPENLEQRMENYAFVQQVAEEFKKINQTIICRDLLKSVANQNSNPRPAARTEAYYSTKPCGRFVADAAYIIGKAWLEKSGK